tara:strand:+ start:4879 stop:5469 length:591 start_codon:yes stop_codon:yes gene_type:complete
MATIGKYKTRFGRKFTAGRGLPVVSTDIDSVRTYQFEVHFFGSPDSALHNDYTLAAKQVNPVNYGVEDIEVHRVNDRLFYPGKPGAEELTITFDNLYSKDTTRGLWDWFKSTYDPLTGEMTKFSKPAIPNATFKAHKMEVILLDNTLTPHSVVAAYGVWPKSWRTAELNYNTNEFHTIEVAFRFDFLDNFNLAFNS